MCDHQRGLLAVAAETQELLVETLACQRVERAEGLVQQKKRWTLQQRARERDALGHAAGELRGIGVGEGFQPHQGERRTGPFPVVLIERLMQLQREEDVFEGRAPWHQIRILKDEPDLRLWGAHGDASELYLACSRRQQTAENAQERRLAAAAVADHTDKLMLLQGEGDLCQRRRDAVRAGVVVADVVRLQ